MTQEVTDPRSNPNDQIAHAANVIKKSKHRKLVFETIYRGQKKIKTLKEISDSTGLPEIRVTQEATNLFNNSIISRKKVGQQYQYGKDKFYTQHKTKILKLAQNKNKLKSFPTKYNQPTQLISLKIPITKNKISATFIGIEKLLNFSKIKKIKNPSANIPISEKKFKQGLKKIIGQKGEFKDWGGEQNDLFSTKIIFKGKNMRIAFALKGKGKKGTLTPAKMGKHGDQIQRLFESPADIFFVQYWDNIGERVIQQMESFAMLNSYKFDKEIFFGMIDGQDTRKIIDAFQNNFDSDMS